MLLEDHIAKPNIHVNIEITDTVGATSVSYSSVGGDGGGIGDVAEVGVGI